MRFHWLRLRATAHPTEDADRVQEAMRNVTGLDADAFAPLVQRTALDGHHGGRIVVLEAVLTRAKEIRATLDRVLPPDARRRAADEAEARTDDDGVLYVRVEKQAAYAGRVEATTGEDAVQVRVKPQVHPAGRERAVAALRAWLSG